MSRTLVALVAQAVSLAWLAACAPPAPGPAALDPQASACRSCRMTIADARFASQIVAPGREPMFFDDLACLRSYLRNGTNVPSQFEVFVADHRTAEWVKAESAVFTRVAGLDTPMGSGVLAHADALSRDADPVARGGEGVPLSEVAPALRRSTRTP